MDRMSGLALLERRGCRVRVRAGAGVLSVSNPGTGY
jgi:hypothetical protein